MEKGRDFTGMCICSCIPGEILLELLYNIKDRSWYFIFSGTGGVEGEMAEHSHTTETDAKPEKAAKGCQLGTVPQKKCELCDVAYITEHVRIN